LDAMAGNSAPSPAPSGSPEPKSYLDGM
jgi:hypothetical protein